MNSDIGFLFDLDGVLIDSESEYTKIWAEIDRRFPTKVDNLPIIIKGMTLVDIIDKYFPIPEYREAVPRLLYELEAEMKYEWLPGARRLLEVLSEKKIPKALVTSSNMMKMRKLYLQHPYMETMFDHIVTGDQVKKSKPDPEGYLLGAGLIGRTPKKCVVFEDSLQGVKAGRSAGAYVVGVAGTLKREVLAPFSDIVVDTLENIDIESIVLALKERDNE
ncbi:MAG: HAD-IA family hydrolase [Muribaculaceae bacterium]|nr:HAD-IA family hydrolase [Muribaculaceae bacterium]